MCEHHAVSVQKTLESMMARTPFATIFLLDCCRLNIDDHESRGKAKAISINEEINSVLPIKGVAGSLVAYACASDEKNL